MRLRTAYLAIAAILALPAKGIEQSPPYHGGETVSAAPSWFGSIVERHVRSMRAQGQYHAITDGVRDAGETTPDLFHGHLLTDRHSNLPTAGIERILMSTRLILYHTEELTGRWNQDPRPPRERTQRSILGWFDGTTQPAIAQVTPQDQEIYTTYGTVFGHDVERAIPGVIDGEGPGETLTVNGTTGRCVLRHQFLINPEPDGRFSSGAQRFEVYLVCEEPEPSIETSGIPQSHRRKMPRSQRTL